MRSLNQHVGLVIPLVLLVCLWTGHAEGQRKASDRGARAHFTATAGAGFPHLRVAEIGAELATGWHVGPTVRYGWLDIGGDCVLTGPCYTSGRTFAAGLRLRPPMGTTIRPFLGAELGRLSRRDSFTDDVDRMPTAIARAGADLVLLPRLAIRGQGSYAHFLEDSRHAAGPYVSVSAGLRISAF